MLCQSIPALAQRCIAPRRKVTRCVPPHARRAHHKAKPSSRTKCATRSAHAEHIVPKTKEALFTKCFFVFGDPYGNRTHVSALRGRRLSRLTNRPYCKSYYTTQMRVCQEKNTIFEIFLCRVLKCQTVGFRQFSVSLIKNRFFEKVPKIY